MINIPIVISGGVSSIADVVNIKKNKFTNFEGIIIGKAIYDGNIDIKKLSKMILNDKKKNYTMFRCK